MKLIIGIIIVVAGIAFFNWKGGSDSITYQPSTQSNRFVINTGFDGHFVYDLEQRSLVLTGSAVSVDPITGTEGAGSFLGVNFLSPSAVEKFQKKYGRSQVCPAPFMNKHVESKILLAANPKVASILNNWTLRADSQSHLWEEFSVEGRCIERMVEGTKNGEIAFLHDDYFQDCRIILIDKLRKQ